MLTVTRVLNNRARFIRAFALMAGGTSALPAQVVFLLSLTSSSPFGAKVSGLFFILFGEAAKFVKFHQGFDR